MSAVAEKRRERTDEDHAQRKTAEVFGIYVSGHQPSAVKSETLGLTELPKL